MPTLTSSGEMWLVHQSQLMSPLLGHHLLHASGHGGLLVVTPGLHAQGKGQMQSNLSDRVGSSALGSMFCSQAWTLSIYLSGWLMVVCLVDLLIGWMDEWVGVWVVFSFSPSS